MHHTQSLTDPKVSSPEARPKSIDMPEIFVNMVASPVVCHKVLLVSTSWVYTKNASKCHSQTTRNRYHTHAIWKVESAWVNRPLACYDDVVLEHINPVNTRWEREPDRLFVFQRGFLSLPVIARGRSPIWPTNMSVMRTKAICKCSHSIKLCNDQAKQACAWRPF